MKFSIAIAIILSGLTHVSADSVSRLSRRAGGGNGGNGGGDPQTSQTLDPAVIASGFANDGQNVPEAGQVASLTSTNNFINFCLTVSNLPITNGKQVATGSCNPAPMGVIPSKDNMPSSKFTNPKNGDTVAANNAFTISMAINNFQSGAFVNAQENYFAAPQQVNGQGLIIGHSHVVVETLQALDQTTPTDPRKFAFFKGLNSAAQGGILTADVTAGLPAGSYRLCSINTAANHQPALVPIAQHGSLDDCVYFSATDGGAAAAAPGTGAGATASSTAATATSTAADTGASAATSTAAGAGANTPASTATDAGAGAATPTAAGKDQGKDQGKGKGQGGSRGGSKGQR